MHRRDFLRHAAAAGGALVSGAALSAFSPERAHAAAQMAAAAAPEWGLATRDLLADVPRTAMRRLHGRAPAGLEGALYRNGPGLWRRPGGAAQHWFDGDGLLRAFRVADGQATLEARFIDTEKRRIDAAAGAVVTPGFGTKAGPGAHLGSADDANPANINVMPVGDELWALWEGGSPTAIDPATLATKGVRTLGPNLAHMPYLAHPKIQPDGRVWNLGQNGSKAIIWRTAADGTLEGHWLVDLGRASYMHDFTATERHLVILLQPLVQSRMVLPFNESFAWRPELGLQVLVLDKDDPTKRRTYELPGAFFFHLGDAWSDADGTIRFDACMGRGVTVFDPDEGRRMLSGEHRHALAPHLHLVTLGADGRARMEDLGAEAEFPRTDPRFAGRPRRYSVHATGTSPDRPLFQGLAVRDWKTGAERRFDFGPHHMVEEAVFTPRPGSSAEFDGWLLAPTLNLKAGRTELHVFDARAVDRGPIAAWAAEAALPVSLHGSFVAA